MAKTEKPILWQMPCPWCEQKRAYSIMMDAKHRLYARCSFDCGISFAEIGIVRWVQRTPSKEIEPMAWKADQIAAYLMNHPAF